MISSPPSNVLDEASLRGNEYAWPVELIPNVIASCKAARFVSLGGQLQFRLPAGTCECNWVEVDTRPQLNGELEWDDLVDRSAASALSLFGALKLKLDFMKEGRKAFSSSFSKLEYAGGDPQEYVCFVWYACDRESYLTM